MEVIAIKTGQAAIVPDSLTITDRDFGYTYGGFKSVGRFVSQMDGHDVGLITWPGGTLSEKDPDRYGFQYDDLFNPAANQTGLSDMFKIARDEGATLSIKLPTARYLGHDAQLQTDLRAFMGKLLSGHYGTLPDHLQIEIGNEWYSAFGPTAADASAYGHIADLYLREIAGALNDPQVNRIGADIQIGVQAGRTLVEDAAIRHEIAPDHIAEVDMVIHHRFAFTAEGVDKGADVVGSILDAWDHDSHAAGGDRPELFLGAYNVASLTRDEALAAYVKSEAALGHVVHPEDIDLEHRTDTGFETFWQKSLAARDYGAEQPRLLLETFAEYGGEGMGGAAVYGVDMQHAGRFTTRDTAGHDTHFVGQDMLDMLAETTKGTRLLDISLTNGRGTEVWTYGFESADKLVIFLSADATPPGQVSLAIKGLGTDYKAVFGDSLTAETPADWMTRFGIPDNPNVDETPEGRGYALGHRAATPVSVNGDQVGVTLSQPYQVIRLAFAKTDAGLQELASVSDDAGLTLHGPVTQPTDGSDLFGDLPQDIHDTHDHHGHGHHGQDDSHDPHHQAAHAMDGGHGPGGGFLAALLPFLFFI